MPIKGMELEDVQSDLQALRKLYGLLQSSGDGVQIARNEILDERARLLLKNLLDGAVERILETHLKMIAAAHSGVSNTSCFSKPEQSKSMPKLQIPVSPNRASVSVIPKSNKSYNHYSFTWQKEEPSPTKCCWVCKKSSMQQQNSAKIPRKDSNHQDSSFNGVNINGHEKGLVQPIPNDPLKSYEKLRQKRIGEIQRNPSIVSSVATGQKFQSEEVSNFSKQVTDAIQRIESSISDLQLCSGYPYPINNAAAAYDHSLCKMPNSVPSSSIIVQTKEGLVARSHASQSVKGLVGQNASMTSQTSKYVHGLRVPPIHDDVAKKPQIIKDSPAQNLTAQKETIRKAVKSGPSMQPPSVRSTSSIRPIHKKNLPHQIIMRPTLLDHESPVLYRDRTDKNLPHKQEESENSSSQCYSSSWTTQQTSTSSSGTEAYSLPSGTRAHHRMGPTSKRFTHEALESSIEESSSSSYSLQSHYRDVGPSRKVGPTKTYRSRHQTNPTKAIGRLKRFKNKLGLIFHHHHHHHHHEDDDGNHTKPGNTTSTWNNLQKIFHRSSKKQHEAYGEHVVDKLSKKSMVSNVPRKQQVGHFHALVQGLMRHARHSKKSKPSKSGIGRLGNNKIVKKMHWWQMAQRYGGVKLPNRGHVKLGFKNKKSHLKAQLR